MTLKLLRKVDQSVIIAASTDLHDGYLLARVRDVRVHLEGATYSVEPRSTMIELDFFAPRDMMIVRSERYFAEHGQIPNNTHLSLDWHHFTRRPGQSVLIAPTTRMLAPDHVEVRVCRVSLLDKTGASVLLPPARVDLDLEILAPTGLHVDRREDYERVLMRERTSDRAQYWRDRLANGVNAIDADAA